MDDTHTYSVDPGNTPCNNQSAVCFYYFVDKKSISYVFFNFLSETKLCDVSPSQLVQIRFLMCGCRCFKTNSCFSCVFCTKLMFTGNIQAHLPHSITD